MEEDIYARTNVPSLSQDNPQEEDEEQNNGADPTVSRERGRGVKVRLVLLQHHQLVIL